MAWLLVSLNEGTACWCPGGPAGRACTLDLCPPVRSGAWRRQLETSPGGLFRDTGGHWQTLADRPPLLHASFESLLLIILHPRPWPLLPEDLGFCQGQRSL